MENNKIYIPNLSLGNTKSVVNMINRLGGEVVIANTPDELLEAKKVILPGVGSFDVGMKELNEHAWVDVLNKLALERKIPILGICLGMQFFFDESEEGALPGLGWIPGKLMKFVSQPENPIKVPHMGWNAIKLHKSDSLFPVQDEELRYYFVHSYHAVCADPKHIVATAYHGSDVTASVQKDNIYGFQFHPEKSHRFGMELLKIFLSI